MLKTEDPYASMEKDQLISMIHFLVKREEERVQEIQELKDMIRDLKDAHMQDIKIQERQQKIQENLMRSIDQLTKQLAESSNEKAALEQENRDLSSRISVNNKVRFGSTSQKGIRKNTAPVVDRQKDKDDFDGTNGAAMSSVNQEEATPVADAEAAEQPQKNYDNRKGMKYQTMYADKRIMHKSDINLLPEGATIIKSVTESTYEQISYIVQHDYEMIIYKDKDGKIRKGYFPMAGESADIDRFPGTHASTSLLANLVFNKYHMNTPVYREMVRLLNNRMNVSRNTVYNWFVKGSEYLKKALPILKEKLLAPGAVVNCDETFIYHTFIETCKMCGVSTLEYFKEFFTAIMQGRTDERSLSRTKFHLSYAMQGGGRENLNRLRKHVTDDHRY